MPRHIKTAALAGQQEEADARTREAVEAIIADVRERGVLLGSGFVGGEGLLGVGIAAVAFMQNRKPEGIGTDWLGGEGIAQLAGLVAFGFLIAGFSRMLRR